MSNFPALGLGDFGILCKMKKTYVSFSGYGVDVSSQRADDLDKLCREHLTAKSSSRVLDLGAGAGGLSVRLAAAGAEVIAVDSYDFGRVFHQLRIKNHFQETQLQFVCEDVTSAPAGWMPDGITDVVVQRTIHYIRYAEALRLLSFLYQAVTDKLFISVTGMDSVVGAEYAGRAVVMKDRFFSLAPEQVQTFSISQPVCLYTKAEFITLLETSGWKVEDCWESAFGNIKAVCSH